MENEISQVFNWILINIPNLLYDNSVTTTNHFSTFKFLLIQGNSMNKSTLQFIGMDQVTSFLKSEQNIRNNIFRKLNRFNSQWNRYAINIGLHPINTRFYTHHSSEIWFDCEWRPKHWKQLNMAYFWNQMKRVPKLELIKRTDDIGLFLALRKEKMAMYFASGSDIDIERIQKERKKRTFTIQWFSIILCLQCDEKNVQINSTIYLHWILVVRVLNHAKGKKREKKLGIKRMKHMTWT